MVRGRGGGHSTPSVHPSLRSRFGSSLFHLHLVVLNNVLMGLALASDTVTMLITILVTHIDRDDKMQGQSK